MLLSGRERMEWKIILVHENGLDRVEIVGIGEDPHRPADIITASRGPIGKKTLEEILRRVRTLGTPVIIPTVSERDLYAFAYHAGSMADKDPSWRYESNLPALPDPEEEHEGDEVLII